ncbi:hypothetical protein [Chitinophaga solisilvae]|uniref:hypothetical protein n=1 Tax=Chitinophaga solisilvae TaxID=1233460 RepID=UPI00136BBC4A|nr:hypothetical protein [Chitinophaga solisilvae]
MKKVVPVLLLCSSVVLLYACRGILKDTVPTQTNSPDLLPLFVITLGNCPQIPTSVTTPNTLVITDKDQLQTEHLKDAVLSIIDIYQRK